MNLINVEEARLSDAERNILQFKVREIYNRHDKMLNMRTSFASPKKTKILSNWTEESGN